MGFLQAVYGLGVMVSEKATTSPVSSFTQLPHPLGEPEEKKAHVILIGLEVDDSQAKILDVKGIAFIRKKEYTAIGDDDSIIRERCLFREPIGRNVQWRFTPLEKLGKGSKESIADLLGDGWQNDRKSRFYKIQQRVLRDYETSGFFTQGSVARIMADLETKAEEIATYWNDKNRSYLLIFGVSQEGDFLYPGEIPAFTNYFIQKLSPDTSSESEKGSAYAPVNCALCRESTTAVKTLDKVFKFATFDKPGFLPGTKSAPGVPEKVYPICQDCYAKLSAGKEEMENKFINLNTLPGMVLYVIPEVISAEQAYNPLAIQFTKDFLKTGITHEPRLFKKLAKQGDGLVYHFLFAEINQAQVIVHFLVEDIPPSRLKTLEKLWIESGKAINKNGETETSDKADLDVAFRQIVAVLLSLAGKSEQEQKVMREKTLDVIAGLLNGDLIDIFAIKTLMVSRFPGLFADPDWITPRDKQKMPGHVKLKGMAKVIDFLSRVNGRRNR